MAKKSTRITISLGDKEHQDLCELSEQSDVSVSWIVRQAVSEFLSRHGEGQSQLPLKLSAQKKVAQ